MFLFTAFSTFMAPAVYITTSGLITGAVIALVSCVSGTVFGSVVLRVFSGSEKH